VFAAKSYVNQYTPRSNGNNDESNSQLPMSHIKINTVVFRYINGVVTIVNY